MKILELRLMAFGPFTDRVLPLSDDGAAMHVIYGENEAGKSTALRAIAALFYGIPQRTADAHLHDMKKLRVGAVIETGSGERLELVRRKGNKRTLLDAREEVVDDALLQRALGGVTQALFSTMFGLDHVTLREGAQALLRGDGDVGESLFDAGGARGIGRVLASLREEADAIFKPRGQAPRLNDALRGLKDSRHAIQLKEMLPGAWVAQKEATEAAQLELEALALERQRLASEKNRLERALRVLPHLAKRGDLLQRREGLGPVPPLGADARDRRMRAISERDHAHREAEQLERDIATLGEERDALPHRGALADIDEDIIRDIRDRLGNHRKAAADMPRRQERLAAIQAEVKQLFRELGREFALADVSKLWIDKPTQARIEAQKQAYGRCVAELDETRGALDEAKTRLAFEEAALAALADAGDPEPLRKALARAQRDGDLDGALSQAEQRVDELMAALVAEERELAARVARMQTDLDELAELGAPAAAELDDKRRARDAAWIPLRHALERGERCSAEAYETARAEADDVADRLWQQADRVAKRARVTAERDAGGRALDELRRRNAELHAAGGSRQHPEIERARKDGERIRLAIAGHRAALGEHVNADGALAVAIDRAALLLEKVDRAQQQRSAQEAKVADLGQHVRMLEKRAADKQAAFNAWKALWAEAMAKLGLEAEASVEEAAVVMGVLRDLFARMRDAQELERRIDGMRRDAGEFVGRLRPILQAHAPELAELPVEQGADALIKRHGAAITSRALRADLEMKLAHKTETLHAVRVRAQIAEGALGELMQSAGADDLEALEIVEQRATELQSLEQRIVECEESLFAEGGSIEELLELTRDLDIDQARSRAAELEEQQREATERWGELQRTIGRDREGLAQLEGREGAAAAAADTQAILAGIHRHAERYARVKLAAVVLEREIERYRQRHQGPILARASELFPRLTLGGYTRLSVSYDAHDEPELLCTRADGKELGVSALSDGVRDQLYLALRLASLERYAERNELLPFIADDILIHFDDERARAALSVLCDFAATTQVLFFTHHARLVELCRDLDPRRVSHHTLR